MNKKILLIGLIAISSISLMTGCGCEKKEKQASENSIVENKNKDVIKDQTLEMFKFTNVSLYYDKDKKQTTIKALVTNTSDEDQVLDEFRIKVYKDDEFIVELTGWFGSVIKAGESEKINGGCLEDLSEATRVEYTVIR